MDELKAIGKHITTDRRLLKKRAAPLAEYTVEVVADIGNTVIYDDWETKYATYTNPDTRQVAHRSTPDAVTNTAIVSSGHVPLDP